MAERVGFEPTLGFPKHAFQACAFSRSATSPLFNFGLKISDCGSEEALNSELNRFPVLIPKSAFYNVLYGGEGGI